MRREFTIPNILGPSSISAPAASKTTTTASSLRRQPVHDIDADVDTTEEPLPPPPPPSTEYKNQVDLDSERLPPPPPEEFLHPKDDESQGGERFYTPPRELGSDSIGVVVGKPFSFSGRTSFSNRTSFTNKTPFSSNDDDNEYDDYDEGDDDWDDIQEVDEEKDSSTYTLCKSRQSLVDDEEEW